MLTFANMQNSAVVIRFAGVLCQTKPAEKKEDLQTVGVLALDVDRFDKVI